MENLRIEVELMRLLADETRKEAEERRKEADEARKQAEEERKKAEEERKKAEEERKKAQEERKKALEMRKIEEHKRQTMLHRWTESDRENVTELGFIDIDTQDQRSVLVGFFVISSLIGMSIIQCCPANSPSPCYIISAFFLSMAGVLCGLSWGLWPTSLQWTHILFVAFAGASLLVIAIFLSLHFQTANRFLSQVWCNRNSVSEPDPTEVASLAAAVLVLATRSEAAAAALAGGAGLGGGVPGGGGPGG